MGDLDKKQILDELYEARDLALSWGGNLPGGEPGMGMLPPHIRNVELLSQFVIAQVLSRVVIDDDGVLDVPPGDVIDLHDAVACVMTAVWNMARAAD